MEATNGISEQEIQFSNGISEQVHLLVGCGGGKRICIVYLWRVEFPSSQGEMVWSQRTRDPCPIESGGRGGWNISSRNMMKNERREIRWRKSMKGFDG